MKSYTEYLTMHVPTQTGFVNITPQVEAAGSSHFPADHEMWLVVILEEHGDLGGTEAS